MNLIIKVGTDGSVTSVSAVYTLNEEIESAVVLDYSERNPAEWESIHDDMNGGRLAFYDVDVADSEEDSEEAITILHSIEAQAARNSIAALINSETVLSGSDRERLELVSKIAELRRKIRLTPVSVV